VAKEEIGACLETTQGTFPYIQEDYTTPKRWYRHTSARQPNPLRADMEKDSGDYAELYQKEDLSPMGRPVPTHADSFQN